MIKHHLIADYTAAACTVVACIISGWQIHQHFYYNNAKRMRNYCVRVLLMIPIFAVEAYLALVSTERCVVASTNERRVVASTSERFVVASVPVRGKYSPLLMFFFYKVYRSWTVIFTSFRECYEVPF
jgi:hypothetical protein